jgi:hypothetical protein
MDTTRNRSKVLAKFVRASVAQIKRAELLEEETAFDERKNAIESLDAIAAELEEIAATPTRPDPESQSGGPG